MDDQKLSERNETTSRALGYFHIIKQNGLIFESYKIKSENLLAGCPDVTKLSNKTGTQIIEIAANTFINSITLKYVSGTPSVKIGISGLLEKYLSATEISTRMLVKIEDEFETTDDLYITITGGNVNIRLETIANY